MDQTSHIFIVGIPRSGTTLLTEVLNLSPEVAICPETHFFGSPDLKSIIGRPTSKIMANDFKRESGFQQLAEKIDRSTPDGVVELTDLMFDFNSIYSIWLKEHVERHVMRAHLAAGERSDRNLFDTMMAVYAGDNQIRGEKTPLHIFFVPTLMEWFPRAKIIHIIRDPRAVYVSYKKKWKSKTRPARYHQIKRSDFSLVLYLTVFWLQANNLHHAYTEHYPNNYYSCRFEDITQQPENHLVKICEFLGINFNETILQPEFHNSGYFSQDVKVVGFDTAANIRWREHIHPITNLWFKLWARNHSLTK